MKDVLDNMVKNTTSAVVAVIAIVCFASVIFSGCIEQDGTSKPDLTLSNYPELFEKDVIIVIGENTSQVERESAEAIAPNLENLTGHKPIIKSDGEIAETNLGDYNLLLVGTPESNKMFKEVYNMTDATRVTDGYPGENKGILEILENPWDEDKAMLLVAGSDEWGVKTGDLILRNQRLEKKNKIFVDWVEYTGVEFPIDSEEEAIKYAKTDPDVERFIKEWSEEGFKVGIWGAWDPIYNVWEVGISPRGEIRDILFLLHIKPNGVIIDKGIVPTA
ncbi:MAG: hypothetical protein SVM80_09455 [Halobacteriota archaeon]|nr:hypothetical protein [Halobacteriota archaeon]